MKLKDYTIKHRYWADQTLKHLSYSINLFTTIGIALLTFQISKSDPSSFENLNFALPIDWKIFLQIFATFLSLLTVISGLMAVTAHLYELRITRHLFNIERSNKNGTWDKFIELKKYCLFKNYTRTLFKEIPWINLDLITNKKQLKKEYKELNLHRKLLGDFTWKTHKMQLLTLFLSLIIYLAYQIL